MDALNSLIPESAPAPGRLGGTTTGRLQGLHCFSFTAGVQVLLLLRGWSASSVCGVILPCHALPPAPDALLVRIAGATDVLLCASEGPSFLPLPLSKMR